MFQNPFSFSGRIRRTEYALSFLVYFVAAMAIGALSGATGTPFFGVLVIPIVWFLWAQGAKRCHDIGSSGWMQIVPFYFFWLLFSEGHKTDNKYGRSPKAAKQSAEFTLDEV